MDNPLEKLLGYQLRRASNAIVAGLAHVMEDLDLRPTEVSVLVLIQRNANITQSAIGRILGVQRANMAPVIALLEERGLITRSPADGRSHALDLSDAGQAVTKIILQRIDAHEANVLPQLSADERAALIKMLAGVWKS